MKTYILIASTDSIKREELEDIGAKVYASYEEFEEEVNPEAKGIEVYLLTDFISSINDEAIWTEGSWIGYVHIHEKQTVWLLEECDRWFVRASRIFFGVFASRDEAITKMEQNWKDLREIGTNQWISDESSSGIQISEVYLDKFEEL